MVRALCDGSSSMPVGYPIVGPRGLCPSCDQSIPVRIADGMLEQHEAALAPPEDEG